MIWDDTGFLISKNKYNENSLIAEVYTKNYGKVSGIIFGASSKKIKNYLQVGNLLHINHTYKNTSKIVFRNNSIIFKSAESSIYKEVSDKTCAASDNFFQSFLGNFPVLTK